MTNIIGQIPARFGSKRVKQKNLRDLGGKPLIWYAINAAKDSKKLDEVYVNSEHDQIGQIGIDYGIKYYKRSKELAGDNNTLDEFCHDFIKNTGADILVMINPVAPLIEGSDIDGAIEFFIKDDFDTVITVKEEKLQSFCDGKAINFNPNGMLPKTQDIPPVQLCAWSVCVWRARTFVESFESRGYAVFSGKVGFYPISALKAVKISTEDDFKLAEALIKYRSLSLS